MHQMMGFLKKDMTSASQTYRPPSSLWMKTGSPTSFQGLRRWSQTWRSMLTTSNIFFFPSIMRSGSDRGSDIEAAKGCVAHNASVSPHWSFSPLRTSLEPAMNKIPYPENKIQIPHYAIQGSRGSNLNLTVAHRSPSLQLFPATKSPALT